MREYDVCVIGSGIVGLAAALGYAQRNLRVALVGPDPITAPSPNNGTWDTRIYALSPGSIELLTQLRVWPNIPRERVQAVKNMLVSGDTSGQLNFNTPPGSDQLAHIVESNAISNVLAHAIQYSNITHYPATFNKISEFSANNNREISLSDQTTLTAQLVIGADGRQSSIRAALGINHTLSDYEQTAIVGNFKAHKPHHGTAFQWFSQTHGVIALLPLPDDHVSMVWSAPNQLKLTDKTPEDLLQTLYTHIHSPVGALEWVTAPAYFPLSRLDSQTLTKPGVILMGDAAHGIHPLAGQGLNLGLQDVQTALRIIDQDKTRTITRPINDHNLLQEYARSRKEPIMMMQWTTQTLAHLFTSKTPGIQFVRNKGMNMINHLGFIKDTLTQYAMR